MRAHACCMLSVSVLVTKVTASSKHASSSTAILHSSEVRQNLVLTSITDVAIGPGLMNTTLTLL